MFFDRHGKNKNTEITIFYIQKSEKIIYLCGNKKPLPQIKAFCKQSGAPLTNNINYDRKDNGN